jgi:GNAT superfamily N-acetyltransferase
MIALSYSPLVESFGSLYYSTKSIYNTSFDEEERVPFDKLFHSLTSFRDNAHGTIGAYMDGQKVIGMGSAIYFHKKNMGYLAYLAVDAELRCQGYGQQITQQLLEWINNSARETGHSPRATFWEVRDPLEALDKNQRILRRRRIKFYRRLGAKVIPVRYVTPPVSDGLPEVPYLLMVKTLPLGKKLTRQEVMDIVWLGLVEVNGVKPESALWINALKSINASWPK